MKTRQEEAFYYYSHISATDVIRRMKLGEYCENCMILIGENHLNTVSVMYKTFFVCEDCEYLLKKEVQGEKIWLYSINDLEGM